MLSLRRLLGQENNTIVRSRESVAAVPGYPWSLVRPIELSDGRSLSMRPIRPDDERRLVDLFGRLSAQTVYQRFFRAYDRLPDEWYPRFANVDYRGRLALVAEDEENGRAVVRGVARYEPSVIDGVAEVAIVVEDAWQGRGLGLALLEALLAAAEPRGFRRFTADILADNRRMLRLLRRVAEIHHHDLDAGVLTIEFQRRRALPHAIA